MTGYSRLPARLLRKIAAGYHRTLLEQDFSRVMRTAGRAGTTATNGPRVAIASFGSGEWHLVLELLLAHALRLRGARLSLLACDLPDLPICDERTVFSRRRDRCDGCIAAKRDLLAESGIEWQGVSRFVDDPSVALARATERVIAIDEDAIEQHVERGFPVGRWLHVSGCHFLRCDERGSDPHKVQTRRRLLATAIVIAEAVENWLDDTRPDVVIAESGAHLMWRIAFEAARRRGIGVVCREMGKRGWDRHIYALNSDAMAPDLDAEWTIARTEPLCPDEEAEVDRLVDDLPGDTYGGPSGHRAIAPVGRPTAVAFTNVTWDLATAGRDVGFAGVMDWLGETISTVAGLPDVHLIVRAHPAEAAHPAGERILNQVRTQWPDGVPNVTLIDPEADITAQGLCQSADLILAYNSTAALEAVIRGRTAVVCGRPHFRSRGFTIDVSTRDQYRQVLAQWASGVPMSSPEGAQELARRYFHLFFARYHVTMGWTTSPLAPPYRLLVQSIDELAPGRNAALDVVCAGILEGRQILLPRQLRGASSAR